jgi:hypothetical protein
MHIKSDRHLRWISKRSTDVYMCLLPKQSAQNLLDENRPWEIFNTAGYGAMIPHRQLRLWLSAVDVMEKGLQCKTDPLT